MEKLLVEIRVPILSKSFDCFIPEDVQIKKVLDLVEKAVRELSGGLFIPDGGTVLCSGESGKVLDINQSANEQGIQNGSQLMLI